MAELQITIVTESNTDYDGVTESVKKATGTIDGGKMATVVSCADIETDEYVKGEFRSAATAQGYSWDTEI